MSIPWVSTPAFSLRYPRAEKSNNMDTSCSSSPFRLSGSSTASVCFRKSAALTITARKPSEMAQSSLKSAWEIPYQWTHHLEHVSSVSLVDSKLDRSHGILSHEAIRDKNNVLLHAYSDNTMSSSGPVTATCVTRNKAHHVPHFFSLFNIIRT